MWRNFEGAVWRQAEHREAHSKEFTQWQQGKLFFWCGWMGGWLDDVRAAHNTSRTKTWLEFLCFRILSLFCVPEIRWLASMPFVIDEIDVTKVHSLRDEKTDSV